VPPWSQLLDAWRLLAAATFPPPDITHVADSASSPLLPPPFSEFTQWAHGKGLCRLFAFTVYCLLFQPVTRLRRLSRMRFDAIAGCGYGCIARQDIAPGDVVITVPAALVISSDAAMDSR
jgi:hypothetical protein